MRPRYPLLAAAMLAFAGTLPAQQPQARQAQPQARTPQQAQQPATATHIVVRYFQCPMGGEAIRRFQEGRPIVQQMISEGKFLDYGLLSHNWGDEWNVVDYFVVASLDGFFANFDEMMTRMNTAAQARPAPEAGQPARRPFNELCTAHKDNIYSIVQPSAQQASSP